jgi:hypothetical protein
MGNVKHIWKLATEPAIILEELNLIEDMVEDMIYSNVGENVEAKETCKDFMTVEKNAYNRVCSVMEFAPILLSGILDHSGNVEMNAGLKIKRISIRIDNTQD